MILVLRALIALNPSVSLVVPMVRCARAKVHVLLITKANMYVAVKLPITVQTVVTSIVTVPATITAHVSVPSQVNPSVNVMQVGSVPTVSAQVNVSLSIVSVVVNV